MIVDLVFAVFDVLAWILLLALTTGWIRLHRLLDELHELLAERGAPARPQRGVRGGKRPLSEGEIEPPP